MEYNHIPSGQKSQTPLFHHHYHYQKLISLRSHGVHKERPRVAKDLGLTIYAPVMYHAGVADRSPRNQSGYAG